MKVTLSIEELNNNEMSIISEALKGTYLHYSMKGSISGLVTRLDVSDMRNIDVNELVEVLNAMKVSTWKDEGMGGDAL